MFDTNDSNAIDIGGGVGKPPFHHACNALCRPDRGEHADVCWSAIEDIAMWREPQRFGSWLGSIRGTQVTILSIDDAPEAPERGPWGIGPYRRLIRWREPVLQVQTVDGWVTVPGARITKLPEFR